ncbi:MAG: plasmid mobilization relaxosome protein MobC [Bacteroidetes bacterium]|nr:plasmid mobilization relaxosome protein MobC [Bacteroidota bacterium]
MENSKENKTKHIDVRVSESEYNGICKQFKKSACPKLADYARKVLLGKPVVATYRNQSLDDFMAEVIRLRNELNAVGNNFNQAVRKLHTFDFSGQAEQWMKTTEAARDSLLKSMETIEKSISKMADQWLQ